MELGKSLEVPVFMYLSSINSENVKLVIPYHWVRSEINRVKTPNIMLTFRNLDNFRI